MYFFDRAQLFIGAALFLILEFGLAVVRAVAH